MGRAPATCSFMTCRLAASSRNDAASTALRTYIARLLPVPESGPAGEKRHIIPAAEVADVVGGRRQQDIHTLPAHQPLKPLDIERQHVPTSAFPAIHGLTAARARILPSRSRTRTHEPD